MKIIQLVGSRTWGGGERYVLDLSHTLTARGHQVSIFTRGPEAIDNRFSGMPLRHLAFGGPLDLASPIKLGLYLKKQKENVVLHAHNFKTAAVAAKARRIARLDRSRCRIVVTRHLARQGHTSLRWKRLYSSIDHLIFVSEFARQTFLKTDPPIERCKIHVVHNSIIVSVSSTAAIRKQNNAVSLLFIGRISPEKGIDTLIKALALIDSPNIKLRIAGTGPSRYTGELKQLACSLNVDSRIEWAGHIDNVFPEINNTDIGIAPSRAPEAFGLTLLEFMSQGIPVIAADNGAQPEIITTGKNGLLIPPDDENAIASAITGLAGNPGLRADLGKAGTETFNSRFAYNHFMTHILDIYGTYPQN